VCFGCPAAVYKGVASPPVGWHGIVSVNEEKPRKLPNLECHPLSSMRVKIELLTDSNAKVEGNYWILHKTHIRKYTAMIFQVPTNKLQM